MKNGKPHVVHLSEAARRVLRSIARVEGCDLVFSTTTYRLTASENAQPKGTRKREPTNNPACAIRCYPRWGTRLGLVQAPSGRRRRSTEPRKVRYPKRYPRHRGQPRRATWRPFRIGFVMCNPLPGSGPNLHEVVGAWLLCALLATFALVVSAALRLASPSFSSSIMAGQQGAPSSRSTRYSTAAHNSTLMPHHYLPRFTAVNGVWDVLLAK